MLKIDTIKHNERMSTQDLLLMAPIGNSSLPVGRSDALVSTDKAIADKLGIQYVC